MRSYEVEARMRELRAKAERGEATDADLEEAKRLANDRPQAGIGYPGELVPQPARSVPAVSNLFGSVGEYFQSLAATVVPVDVAYGGKIGQFHAGTMDRRLTELRTVLGAASGGSVGVPSEGGFLTGTELSNELLAGAFETGLLAPRVRRRELTGPNNSIKFNAYDETSRATGSRYGAVRAYWKAEAVALEGSKPKFRQVALEPKKLTGLYYATDELLQDAQALEAEIKDAFSSEFGFQIDDAILHGDGVGKPLGIMQSPALVTIDGEEGQAADTIEVVNLTKLYAAWLGQRKRGVWLTNRDTFPQLAALSIEVGTGGSAVGLLGGNVANEPYARMTGMPVLELEQSPTLGDAGDVMLVDPRQYMLVDKGGMQGAVSIHVKFVEDEVVFRFIYRVDGQPIPASAVTPYKGAQDRSPFVALGAR